MSRAEGWASRVLLVGGVFGIALMGVGVLVGLPGIARLGIVALCLTPCAAVVAAGIAFSVDGDRRFTMVSAIVVTLLLLSFWLGGAS